MAEVGTPVYVYSTATMVRHAQVMQAAVAGCAQGEPLVAYAVKANPNPAVLATLARAGLGADVVSIGESQHSLEDVYLQLVDEDVEPAAR